MMYEHFRGQEELFLDERQIQTWLNRVYSRKTREEKALASQQGVEDVDQDVDIEMQEEDVSLNQPTHATLPGRPLEGARHVNHVKYCRIHDALGKHKPNDSI